MSPLDDWQQRRFRVPAGLVRATTLDEEPRHETTALAGGRIVGIDPGTAGSPSGRGGRSSCPAR